VSPVRQSLPFPARWILLGSLALAVSVPLSAQDFRLKLPKRSKPTPVQALNQDGVKAVQKHNYERAKKLFYRAYLLDPNDPFTLNNLGYIAELDGDLDRAQRFYSLASAQPSEAVIDKSSNPDLKGKEVADVAGNAVDQQMEINRSNVYAMGLLMKDRAPEADLVLQKALALDPKNPFTLNNLGFAKEKEGELEQAMRYYGQASATGSNEPVIVTINKDWRGKPIREIAEDNAKAVKKELEHGENGETRVARLNLRGVSAINRNDRKLARQYFQDAFKLDPNNAFTLNNMGYIAEMDSDRETAEYFYAKAREANRAETKVALSTRRDMEGQRMGAVAAVNDQTISDAQQRDLEARRRQGGAVALLKRDNSKVVEPDQPIHPTRRESTDPVLLPNENRPTTTPAVGSQPSGQPSNGQPIFETTPTIMEPLPDNQQPPAAGGQPSGNPTQPQVQPTQEVIPPLPDNQQPPNGQPQVQPEPKVIPPLPDNQQPGNTTPPNGQQSTPPDQQGQPQGGVIQPLPDNQQPPNADTGQPPPQKPPQQK
jgi:Flp pilus assembly protein TadD